MRVELPVERIEKEVDTRLKSVGKTAKIKGFRPGKVPAKVVKQRYGKQIRQEVLSELMQQSYTDAVQQENLNPAGGPRRSKPRAPRTAATSPTSQRSRSCPTSSCGSRQDQGREARSRNRRWRSRRHDREAAQAEGDLGRSSRSQVRTATESSVDFTGHPEGRADRRRAGQGSARRARRRARCCLISRKGLTGVKAGDEKTFKVKFPKDYHAEELQGEKVDFAVDGASGRGGEPAARGRRRSPRCSA